MQRSRKVKEVLEQRGRRAEEIWSAKRQEGRGSGRTEEQESRGVRDQGCKGAGMQRKWENRGAGRHKR